MMVQITSFKNESWGVKSKSGHTKCLLSDILWWLTCLLWGESICHHSLDPVQLRYWNIFTALSRYSTSNLPEWAGDIGIRCLLKSLLPVSKPTSKDNFFWWWPPFSRASDLVHSPQRSFLGEAEYPMSCDSFLQFSSPVRVHRRCQPSISTADSRNCRAKAAVI